VMLEPTLLAVILAVRNQPSYHKKMKM